MEKFKKVEIEDKAWVDEILADCKCLSLEYNFTTLFIWQEIYQTQIREYKGCLLVRFGKEKKSYLFPAGGKNIKAAIDWLLKESCDSPLVFMGMVEEQAQFLKDNYPQKFEFKTDRSMSDYIYTAESLRTLTGKKLSSKRNHINRFIQNNPDWSYLPITDNNIELAIKMHEEWSKLMEEEDRPGLFEEGLAVKKAFKYFNELKLSGGILKAADKAIAFSMGDRLNERTFLVHIEKAFHDIQGAYPMINREFVKASCNGYEFIDREEDTGDEGLRKAKLSYNPCKILKKYNATEI